MHKKILVLFIALILSLPILNIYANYIEETQVNNYQIIIEDDANLLTENEEKELKYQMARLTEFGNVIFKTTNTTINNTSLKYIQNYYYSKFGNNNGVAFYIDMKGRQLCACATGGLDDKITNGKCDTIMDNVYKYATNGDYYTCAIKTFEQMERVLNGQKIAESMKYICNAILSIMISLFVSYGFFIMSSKNKRANQNELVKECISSLNYSPIEVTKAGTRRVYSPVSDSSSSGGGHSSGGRRRRRFLWKRWKSWILSAKGM